MCGLFWGAHKSLAPRARTLLGGLGQATLSSFAVATLLFVLFGECPKFCDLAKQRRKIVGGVSEVGKVDFLLYFFWRCVIFLVFYFSSAAIARRATQFVVCMFCWNLYVYSFMCVSSFSCLRETYVYNLIISLFSGASLGAAPARRPFPRRNFLIPKIKRRLQIFLKMCI